MLRSFETAAESRLVAPREGGAPIPSPPGTDWSWRPDIWITRADPRLLAPARNRDMLGHSLSLFHDCGTEEIVLAQRRAGEADSLAAYDLALDCFHFDGSFLSLALTLPEEFFHTLHRNHVLRLTLDTVAEPQTSLLARLNLVQGPNTEQIEARINARGGESWGEFDLSKLGPGERPTTHAWIDLILTRPQMQRLVIRDLTCARYPRADF